MKTNTETEVCPSWEEFPTYEQSSMGWRMGSGECYRYRWYDFLETLPKDYSTRLAYLQRHQPAPINWCRSASSVLFPDIEPEEEYEYDCSKAEQAKLLELGVIKYDAAYQTWLQQQTEIVWPWSYGDSPEEAVRYRARDFEFFSRHFNEFRIQLNVKLPSVPRKWKAIKTQFLTATLGKVDPSKGLLTLAQMLCAGDIRSPWQLGLPLSDFKDSFEDDMGYSDAFRLWMMSLDDDQRFLKLFPKDKVPEEWLPWLDEQLVF